MTLQQGLALAVIAGMLALFLWDRWRYDVVALVALLSAVAVGILPSQKAFSGFSNPLLPLIASALVISSAVSASGAVDLLLRPLRPLMRTRTLEVATLTAAVTVLSAVLKNIGALAIFLPIALQVARRSERSPSELLMPMSFGSLIGGMMTLIGTSPNLIISSVRQDLLGKPYGMFAFTPVGAGITVVGLVFLAFGWRLIPVRRKEGDSSDLPFRVEDYLVEVRIKPESPLAGKTVADLEALAEGDVTVTAILRDGNQRYIPTRYWQLFANDVLVLESDPHALEKLIGSAQLELLGDEKIAQQGPGAPDIGAVEAVITVGSPMVGNSPVALRLRERYGVNLLAVSRAGRRTRARLRSLAFKEGDVVVLQGRLEAMSDTLASLGCLPLAERNLQLGRPRRMLLALTILAGAVGLSASEIVPPAIAFTAGALLIALFRILTLKQIYDAIEWPILILLGALIPIGEALRDTGVTDLMATELAGLSGFVPGAGMLALVLVITMLVTPLLHHAAAVIVMGPIAGALALKLGFNLDPFLMAVAVGASCDFLSPIGHQNNTFVMGPGGYRFTDYWRLGLPLSTLVVATGVPLILLVWPLH